MQLTIVAFLQREPNLVVIKSNQTTKSQQYPEKQKTRNFAAHLQTENSKRNEKKIN